MQEYIQSNIGKKNKIIEPGPEKQHSYKKVYESILEFPYHCNIWLQAVLLL